MINALGHHECLCNLIKQFFKKCEDKKTRPNHNDSGKITHKQDWHGNEKYSQMYELIIKL